MKLRRVKIKNFRLLENVELILEEDTTVIVGRNNSGKTSFAEVLRRFTSDKKASFQIQDFSSSCCEGFVQALEARKGGGDDVQVRGLLPYIELRMFFQYDPAHPNLGPLAEFVIDLDMDCDEALVVARFELADGAIAKLFENYLEVELTSQVRKSFFRDLADKIAEHYVVKVWAEDPNDPTNRRDSSQSAVRNLLKTGFINAQRGLDDVTTKEAAVLGKILEGLFRTASSANADDKDREIASTLKEAVEAIQATIDEDFRGQLNRLMPTFKDFGYPGLGGAGLTTETVLDVTRLLSNHTRVMYQGRGDVLLPEGHNGLGMRNLIFILLQIVSFYREYRSQSDVPGVHLVIIEEPEAHLHPQMQEAFIRQINALVGRLERDNPQSAKWPVQFVVSTHSSHVANEARFETIRYFLCRPSESLSGEWSTQIKDLRQELPNVPDANFLHQYLTLTRCDLFFADKAILIEGTSERLMLPAIIAKRDGWLAREGKVEALKQGYLDDEDEESVQRCDNLLAKVKELGFEGELLRSQYVTVLEVGGAYAHKFLDLLSFLELKTLIVTDLDPVEKPGGVKALVADAKATSNASINSWFGGGAHIPIDLIAKTSADRTKANVHLSFQCPEIEHGPCGGTFEDAFVLANRSKFQIQGTTADELAAAARNFADGQKKSEFAMRYAIQDRNWTVPRYIKEGLNWLASDPATGFSSGTGQQVGDVLQAEAVTWPM